METSTRTISGLGAAELAGLIAAGEISAQEAVERHIERIEQVNPALNAVIFKRFDEARAEARQADLRRAKGESPGPLHGVPVTVKDSLDLAGAPSTFGLPSRASILAATDEIHVARLRQAGAIVLGKTNVAQLLFFIESDNPLFGRVNNPWQLERSAGGSSGGEAAIIAAGGSSLGLGTDIGGSLRFPSAFCGLAAMKPTSGRTTDEGRYSVPFGQRAVPSQVGPLGRRVEDVALALRVINPPAGSNPGPVHPLGDPARVNISELRVGYFTGDGTFAPAPAARRAVLEAAEVLKRQGATVVPFAPPDPWEALDLYYGIMSSDGGRGLVEALGKNKRDPRISQMIFFAGRSRLTLSLVSRLLEMAGQRQASRMLRNFGHRDTLHYWRLVEAQESYRRRFYQALNQAEGGPLDLLICPPAPLPAITHGSSRDLVLCGAYTILFNLTGYPAGIVPFTRVRPEEELGRQPHRDRSEQAALKAEKGSAGLPVGVQVVARPWQEHVALAAMQAIEADARTRPDFPFQPDF